MRSFFILGVERSGTTLLRLMLDAHSQVAIPFETMVLIEFAEKVKGTYNDLKSINDRERFTKDILKTRCFRSWTPRVSFDEVDLSGCYDFGDIIDKIFTVYATKVGKTIWGEKSPTYESHLYLLNQYFPTSRFINLIRDGRDVTESLMRQKWGPNSFLQAFDHWFQLVRCSRKMGRMLPTDRYLEIRYEDLVCNTVEVMQRVCEFLEIPFEIGMLHNFNKNLNVKIPKESLQYHKNLKTAINKDLVLKWRKEMRMVDQTIVHEIAGDLLEELGYPSGYIHSSGKLVFMRKLYWLFHEALIWRKKSIQENILGR